jgi:glycosyltransferase involved in cell wall biosynthesis
MDLCSKNKKMVKIMKKRIIFVYSEMLLGGSTTSFLSLVNLLDYSKYEVDLLLFNNNGPYKKYIPKEINVLPQANLYSNKSKILKFKKVVCSVLNGSLIIAIFKTILFKKRFVPDKQALAYVMARLSRKIKKDYDIAIGYLEFWPNAYVSKYVKATKKIGWIHTDYEASGLVPRFDYNCFRKLDNIVLVSKECKDSFIKLNPLFEKKSIIIENIMSQKFVETQACEKTLQNNELSESLINNLTILTVCRITINVKGIDRAISITRRLLDQGYKFKWFIIGEGKDRAKVEKMILENKINNNFILLGQKLNPYPYIKNADVFCLPSRYEGKPIAVTEALMLNIPVIVTDYPSAKHQVRNNIDGIISTNDEEGLYNALEFVLNNKSILTEFKENIRLKKFDNISEINKIYKLLEE